MQMTDSEILREYKEAKDPKAQVEILADENVVSIWEMATHLKKIGADINLNWFFKYNPQNANRIKAPQSVKVPEPEEDIFAILIRLENKLKAIKKKITELEEII
jgi:hypothetical protein